MNHHSQSTPFHADNGIHIVVVIALVVVFASALFIDVAADFLFSYFVRGVGVISGFRSGVISGISGGGVDVAHVDIQRLFAAHFLPAPDFDATFGVKIRGDHVLIHHGFDGGVS